MYSQHQQRNIPRIESALMNLVSTFGQRHAKIFYVRIDVRFPSAFVSAKPYQEYISCFVAKMIKNLKRDGLDPYYIWVREQASSEHPHFHFTFLLNGNKIQHPDKIHKLASSLWDSTLYGEYPGAVHYCQDSWGMVRRSDSDYAEQHQQMLDVMGYLAKEYTKGPVGDGVRNFGMSRL
jgi:Protein of unknown function (DUF3296).